MSAFGAQLFYKYARAAWLAGIEPKDLIDWLNLKYTKGFGLNAINTLNDLYSRLNHDCKASGQHVGEYSLLNQLIEKRKRNAK